MTTDIDRIRAAFTDAVRRLATEIDSGKDAEAVFAPTAEAIFWLYSLSEVLDPDLATPLSDKSIESDRQGLAWARNKIAHGMVLWSTQVTTSPLTSDTTEWSFEDPQVITLDMTEATSTYWSPPLAPAVGRDLGPKGKKQRRAYEQQLVGRRVIATLIKVHNALVAEFT